MKKLNKKTNKEPVRFYLNGHDLVIEVDHRGHVCMVEEGFEWDNEKKQYKDKLLLELSATELDRIAIRSKEVVDFISGINRGLRPKTRTCQFSVSFMGDTILKFLGDEDIELGGVEIGCQKIKPKDIARVHKASLAARGLKK